MRNVHTYVFLSRQKIVAFWMMIQFFKIPCNKYGQFRICFNHYFFMKNNTLCSIALNSLITEPGLYVFWLEFQVVTQLSSAVLIVFRTVKRAIKDLRAEGVSLVL